MSEFKVGDWICFEGKELFKATQNDLDCFTGCDLKLWKPQAGEWCIYNFVIMDRTIPIFILPRLDSFGHMYAINQINNEVVSIMFEDGNCLCDCEPFIGELPSWVKDSI